MNDKAVYRTSPATPGLLKIISGALSDLNNVKASSVAVDVKLLDVPT